jgi:hypothetical protein
MRREGTTMVGWLLSGGITSGFSFPLGRGEGLGDPIQSSVPWRSGY